MMPASASFAKRSVLCIPSSNSTRPHSFVTLAGGCNSVQSLQCIMNGSSTCGREKANSVAQGDEEFTEPCIFSCRDHPKVRREEDRPKSLKDEPDISTRTLHAWRNISCARTPSTTSIDGTCICYALVARPHAMYKMTTASSTRFTSRLSSLTSTRARHARRGTHTGRFGLHAGQSLDKQNATSCTE